MQIENHGIHLRYVFWLKMANGQVAQGDCSPQAPADPYVPTLEHTAPHIRRLPRDVGRLNAPRAMLEVGTIRVAD